MDKLEPRAIIFDLGSTLIEYEAVPWDDLSTRCVEAGWQFLTASGVKVPAQADFDAAFNEIKAQYRRAAVESLIDWTVPQLLSELFGRLGVSDGPGLVDGFFNAYYERVDRELFVYDDTVATLERLKSSYPTMGLVSNTIFPERVHLEELRRFGIAPYLHFTVFSSTFQLRKPHPDIFYHAANCAGVAPSECLFVGDRYIEDISGPAAVGMQTILKVRPDREYPADMPPSLRKIETLANLLEHVEV